MNIDRLKLIRSKAVCRSLMPCVASAAASSQADGDAANAPAKSAQDADGSGDAEVVGGSVVEASTEDVPSPAPAPAASEAVNGGGGSGSGDAPSDGGGRAPAATLAGRAATLSDVGISGSGFDTSDDEAGSQPAAGAGKPDRTKTRRRSSLSNVGAQALYVHSFGAAAAVMGRCADVL